MKKNKKGEVVYVLLRQLTWSDITTVSNSDANNKNDLINHNGNKTSNNTNNYY